MTSEPPEVRPFRWIGAIAFFGVVSAALAVLAWEAIDDSFTWIGDGRSQSDAVILATEPPSDPGGSDDSAGAASGDGDTSEDDTGGDDSGGDDGGDDDSDSDADDAASGDGDDQPPATYTVQPGDTGSSIADEVLGDQQAWGRIAELNDIPPGATLSVGDVLFIPES